MLVHRENSLLPSSGGDPSFGAAYSVTAYPVGARASAASSGTTATVDAGHSFRVGDNALIRPGSSNVFTAAVTAVTATTITWGIESYPIFAGDLLVNLGPDTGTSIPNYDASSMALYSDGDGTTSITKSTVTCSSVGEYSYWHKGDGRFWELLRDGDGDVVGVVAGYAGDPGRYNVCDFGAAGDGTTDDTARIQATIDACESNSGGIVQCPTGTYLVTNLTIEASSVTLQGSSVGHAGRAGLTASSATKLLKADATGYALTVGSGSVMQGIVLRDIAIYCSAGSAVKLNTNATFSQLTNVQLKGAGSIDTAPTASTYGVDQGAYAFGATVVSCNVQGFDIGLWFRGNTAAQTEVHRCWVEYNNVGIRCGDTAGGTILSASWIHHSTIENNATYNIEVQNAKELYLENLYLEVSLDGPASDGTYIWSAATIPLAIGLGADVPENIHVRDCRFQGTNTADRAVDLTNVQGLVFDGCRFLNFGETLFVRNNATSVENIYFGNCPGFGPTNISDTDGVEAMTTRITASLNGHAIYGTLGVGAGAPTTAQLVAKAGKVGGHAAAFQRFSSGQTADIVSVETETGTKLIGFNAGGHLTPEADGALDLGEPGGSFRKIYAVDIVSTGLVQASVTAGITAGTTQSQAGATALTTEINQVSTCANPNDGVKLPTAVAGQYITIINNGAQNLQIWPNTDDAIDAGSVDAVDSNVLAAAGVRRYVAYDATNWEAV